MNHVLKRFIVGWMAILLVSALMLDVGKGESIFVPILEYKCSISELQQIASECRYQNTNLLLDCGRIKCAAIAPNGNVAICAFSSVGGFDCTVFVFSMNGKFLYGSLYKFPSVKGSNVLFFTDKNTLCLNTGYPDRIYVFNENGNAFIDAYETRDGSLLELIGISEYRSSRPIVVHPDSGMRLYSCSDAKLEVIDKNGEVVTICDYTAEYANARKLRRPRQILTLFIGIAAVALTCFLIPVEVKDNPRDLR